MGIKKSNGHSDPLDLDEKIVIVEPRDVIYDCRRVYRKVDTLQQELYRLQLPTVDDTTLNDSLVGRVESQLNDMTKRQIARLILQLR